MNCNKPKTFFIIFVILILVIILCVAVNTKKIYKELNHLNSKVDIILIKKDNNIELVEVYYLNNMLDKFDKNIYKKDKIN